MTGRIYMASDEVEIEVNGSKVEVVREDIL